MDLTDEEREVLIRILGKLMGEKVTPPVTPALTIRERRELMRKAAENEGK
ncbi:MAG: hypothetical protein WC356_02225 [Candidatus Micrarchaeia archaeon]|jgi:hypothetical protein